MCTFRSCLFNSIFFVSFASLTRIAPPSAPPQRPDAPPLKQPEKQQPTQRKARVLYDYDAADSTELSLLADEVITFLREFL